MAENKRVPMPTDKRYRALLDASRANVEQPTVNAVLHSLRDVLAGTSRLHGVELYVLSDDGESLYTFEFDRDADAPNQTISDVLENGKEAKEAERWLLSKDFDALDKLFACPAKVSGIAITKNESAKRLSPDERQIGQMAPSTYCRFADHPGSERLINTTG